MIPLNELTENLLIVGDWYKAHPVALNVVKELEEEYGGNIAIGQHHELGFYVLHDQGNGPGLVWQEIKNDNNKMDIV
jgi:hypothetical protein